jgi:hypothetical protein
LIGEFIYKQLFLLPQSNEQNHNFDEHPKVGRDNVKHTKQMMKGEVLSIFAISMNFMLAFATLPNF